MQTHIHNIIYVYTYINTHIHTHIHTCIYSYIHTHTYIFQHISQRRYAKHNWKDAPENATEEHDNYLLKDFLEPYVGKSVEVRMSVAVSVEVRMSVAVSVEVRMTVAVSVEVRMRQVLYVHVCCSYLHICRLVVCMNSCVYEFVCFYASM